MYMKLSSVVCPDGKARTATVSTAQLRLFYRVFVRTRSRCHESMRARVQANGLSVWGRVTWNPEAEQWQLAAASPAFMPEEGRALAAQLLADVAVRCLLAPRPLVECRRAHVAALRRACRLAGVRARVTPPGPRAGLLPALS